MAFGVACPQMYRSEVRSYRFEPSSAIVKPLQGGQIEHTERLTHNLEAGGARSMIAGSIESADALDVGCRQVLSLIVSVEGHELVALEGPVHVDVQFHVLLLQRCDAEANLQTVVAHLTQIGQQLVVGEWRNGYDVVIEQVGRARGVEVGCQYNPVVPESHIQTDVEGALDFPSQVGIGIVHGTQGGGRHATHAHDTVRSDELLRHEGIDASEVTTLTVAHTQVKFRDATLQGFHPSLVRDVPCGADRGEESPAIVCAHLRRTVETGADVQRVAVVKSISRLHQIGRRARTVVVGVGAFPRSEGACREVIVAKVVGVEVRRGGIEAFILIPSTLYQSQQFHLMTLCYPSPPVQGYIPQQFRRALKKSPVRLFLTITVCT